MTTPATTPSFDLGALLRSFEQAAADIKSNKAPPPGAGMDAGDLAVLLSRLNSALPDLIAALTAHQGVITGIDDVLEALRKQGFPYVAAIENALLNSPALAARIEEYLPWIIGAMKAFQPEPTWQPGPGPYRGR